jgi:hypothetical protein
LIVLSEAKLAQNIDGASEILPIPSANMLISGDFKKWVDCMIDTLKILGAGDDISDPSNWLQPEKLKEKLGKKYDVADFVCKHGGLYMWIFGAIVILSVIIFGCGFGCYSRFRR